METPTCFEGGSFCLNLSRPTLEELNSQTTKTPLVEMPTPKRLQPQCSYLHDLLPSGIETPANKDTLGLHDPSPTAMGMDGY